LPRFFLKIEYVTHSIEDDGGVEYTDLEQARRDADGALREIVANSIRQPGRDIPYAIAIEDERRQPTARVWLRDVLPPDFLAIYSFS
jgi:hypothetical protein